ncbi:GNAT family N-acetyltransferase [Paenibacillus sp. OAS669]|uniref:GNAT family N-acetyltransferase n=1 Tax=Paenibacillus sp. OAS669 TaxID=2663821 RepID=UPI00178A8217|nr:GNAT family N-acetyltransferase [Paenibacillus sp. OAS669]MBE1444047.1 GNAT superfamily N-acetyltransferase [Paenibacillus sp. OAS669]
MRYPVLTETLALRLQQAETDFFSSRIRSIGERPGNPEGVDVRSFGSTTAYYIRTMPWGIFNSVKGLSDKDTDKVGDIAAFYRERDRKPLVDISPAGSSPGLFQALTDHGMIQQGFHSVLYGLPLRELPALPDTVDIVEVTDHGLFDKYAEVHCTASGMSIEHKHHFIHNNIGLMHRPGWRLFLASVEGKPAAVAAMHSSGGIASCALAATLPAYRRRGLQTALLQRRMHEAYKEDCELVTAQAGFASTSQNNMVRVGLHLAWTRTVWTLA